MGMDYNKNYVYCKAENFHVEIFCVKIFCVKKFCGSSLATKIFNANGSVVEYEERANNRQRTQ